LLDFAVWSAGAVTVPIYETSSPEQIQWILSDSGAVGCVVETGAHAAAVESVRDRLPQLANLWTVDDGAVRKLADSGAQVTDAVLD
ncbi:AMP-binding protein, partial [Streptomyces sp. URMC 126]